MVTIKNLPFTNKNEFKITENGIQIPSSGMRKYMQDGMSPVRELAAKQSKYSSPSSDWWL